MNNEITVGHTVLCRIRQCWIDLNQKCADATTFGLPIDRVFDLVFLFDIVTQYYILVLKFSVEPPHQKFSGEFQFDSEHLRNCNLSSSSSDRECTVSKLFEHGKIFKLQLFVGKIVQRAQTHLRMSETPLYNDTI